MKYNRTDYNGFTPDTEKYIGHLREMIACRTISQPEYFDKYEMQKFDRILEKNYPLTFSEAQKIENGNSVFLHIKGTNNDEPLLLMSHKDIVHEGKKKWKSPPFDGSIIKGKMYGRGTFDCKGSLCCIFEAVESLLAEGFIPPRDLYILATSNEETGGNDAPDAVEYMKSNGIVPGLLIDEGGAILKIPFPSKVKNLAMIGAVERSSARFVFECSDNADAKKIGREITKKNFGHFEITPEVEELAKGLGEYLKFPAGNVFRFLAKHKKAGAVLLTHAGPDAKEFCGSVTGFSIPKGEEARGIKNPLRVFISGNYYNKLDDLVEDVRKVASEKGLKLVSSTAREADTPVSSSSFGFDFIGKTAKKVYDSIEVLPYPVLGRTDARYFIGYAKNVVRMAPLEISLMQMTKFHCPNENINVSSLAPGVAFYREAIKSYDGIE